MHIDNFPAGLIVLMLFIVPFTPWIDAWCRRSAEHAADPERRGEEHRTACWVAPSGRWS
jgi:hypothetical protein